MTEEQLIKELLKIGPQMKKEIEGALEESALKVVASSKKNFKGKAPNTKGHPSKFPYIDTGRARNSIFHELRKFTATQGAEAKIGSNVKYMKWLEFGTSKHGPYPVFRPALNENIKWIRDRIDRAFKRGGKI